MHKTTKLAIASFVVALAASIGMAAPADARGVATQKFVECC